ncbi:glycosyltransferase family 4 protein [Agrobacterium rhizogenes]|nr:glycosyltransferase family 4 protein [Rhizobium rhizogenes]NTF74011.1 glycosyltransferase family 4 protein [Rhizobium rhizogenes]
MRRRILMDLSTSLQWRGKHAVGIVRTEREIARRLLLDDDVDVVPVAFHAGRFFAIDPEQAMRLVSPSSSTAAIQSAPPVVGGLKAPVPFRLRARVLRPAGAFARFCARGIIGAMPTSVADEVRLAMIHGRQAARNFLYPEPKAAEVDRTVARKIDMPSDAPIDLRFVVHPTDRDVLFLGGLGWDVIDCRNVAAIKRQTGMKVSCVIYDLIPTKFPNYLGGDPRDYFFNYFLHMVDLADHVFCISKTTQGDFYEFCDLQSRAHTPSSVIYLGANLPVASDSAEIPEEIRGRLRDGKYAFAVGTVEIRKNYELLLSLWEKLAEDPAFELDLVIAGMAGWGTEKFIERLESSPLFGKRIFWFRRLSDSGISWLYEHCCMHVFPSWYEGWGLPVVEALQHKKPVIASNRGSVPEAGFGVATIIDPDDHEAWADAIRQFAKETPQMPEVSLPTWDQAAAEVKSRLFEIQ